MGLKGKIEGRKKSTQRAEQSSQPHIAPAAPPPAHGKHAAQRRPATPRPPRTAPRALPAPPCCPQSRAGAGRASPRDEGRKQAAASAPSPSPSPSTPPGRGLPQGLGGKKRGETWRWGMERGSPRRTRPSAVPARPRPRGPAASSLPPTPGPPPHLRAERDGSGRRRLTTGLPGGREAPHATACSAAG